MASKTKHPKNMPSKLNVKGLQPTYTIPRDIFCPRSRLFPEEEELITDVESNVNDDDKGGGDSNSTEERRGRRNDGQGRGHVHHDSKQPAKSRVGLGPVIFNLKPDHYHDRRKKCVVVVGGDPLDYYRKKYPKLVKKSHKETASVEVLIVEEEEDSSLCKSLKELSIRREKTSEEKENVRTSKKGKSVKTKGVGKDKLEGSFKRLVAQRVTYESGQKITVLVDENKVESFKMSSSQVRKAGVRNWKSPAGSEDIYNGTLRNLFSWSLPTSNKWKEVEERIARWKIMSNEGVVNNDVSVEKVAEQLNVTVEEIRHLQFHKSFGKVVEVLIGHICHSSLPWLTTLAAVSDIQKGDHISATRNAAESQGTFLHSEIVDKHVCYISRNEDFNSAMNQRSSFSTKVELFRKQIQDTISFSGDFSTGNSEFTDIISSFNPDWNIVQITAFLHSKNRFGTELCRPRRIPQLLLSVLAHVPNDSMRSIFTTFCQDPPVYEGSLMKLGIMEEFQKILDRNLVISDDSIVISRRNYWEERNKHNQAMKSVIEAMEEEWIGPWSFLLPGHTTHSDIRDKIRSKIINPIAKKYHLSSAQKLVLYKLTENYKYLHPAIASALETVISFIFGVPETGLGILCKKIREIGSEVPLDSRHPTILVVDQDLEIYPWESMSCLVNTDVTRMPSLNLIRSNYNFVTSIRPSYPNIVDSNNCTFVLNPDGTLPNVQKRLEKYFLDHKQWNAVIGRPPLTKEVQECLENQHIFLYNGHGAGSNFYPDYAVQKLLCRAVPLLMGCASAQAHYAVPRVYGSPTIHSYFLAGCPSVVGYLWEVTDAECDRVTVDLIERWLPDKNIRPPKIIFFDQDATREQEKCLQTAMRISRKAATQFLTECAIVCYGLPINTED